MAPVTIIQLDSCISLLEPWLAKKQKSTICILPDLHELKISISILYEHNQECQ